MTASWLEPLVLGLASGGACLASCGPVLVPWLTFESKPVRSTALLLGLFLSGRALGYLGFAVALWTVARALALQPAARAVVFGLAHVALAAALIGWVVLKRPHHAQVLPSGSCLVPAPGHGKRHLPIAPPAAAPALVLGLATGLNLCPPFVAASVRALQTGSLLRCIAFFALFFLGTAVWMLPTVVTGWLSRIEGAAFVARIAAALVAVYYVILGVSALAGAWIHG